MLNSNSVDLEEVAKFEKIADQWWSTSGKFAILHKFNLCRMAYIKAKIAENFIIEKSGSLDGLSALDVGCGGGLLAEPLARLGASVTAIDASEKNIKIAKLHAEKQGLKINYKQSLIENMSDTEKFQIISVMEVIEHVENPEEFLVNCSRLLADDGVMFVATINRTLKSLLLAKIAAEYILNWVPKGAHQWKKFLKPSEIVKFLKDQKNIQQLDLTGVKYNILNDSWSQSRDVSQNYILLFKKK
ncbi:MAG: bifunctional 2-polyprenyl-6-hydroxyphenol methylase/3-demethylubiquinol 3-O-methyltransferase UbiG [Rickettsiales bacterium]|jgi:2-polyprenyl-6-hydroxyphenyl methylase / 3-demethylubiquinone-9 3-methyltransferase|nr:bifunctional 2-polyprenyl-6-hydroxyphenol methylase/3-demethylubiquinol 3-O-methyltransferase UbiG [Rickettsiales bacterium]